MLDVVQCQTVDNLSDREMGTRYLYMQKILYLLDPLTEYRFIDYDY